MRQIRYGREEQSREAVRWEKLSCYYDEFENRIKRLSCISPCIYTHATHKRIMYYDIWLWHWFGMRNENDVVYMGIWAYSWNTQMYVWKRFEIANEYVECNCAFFNFIFPKRDFFNVILAVIKTKKIYLFWARPVIFYTQSVVMKLNFLRYWCEWKGAERSWYWVTIRQRLLPDVVQSPNMVSESVFGQVQAAAAINDCPFQSKMKHYKTIKFELDTLGLELGGEQIFKSENIELFVWNRSFD